jgi:hypothetical protein
VEIQTKGTKECKICQPVTDGTLSETEIYRYKVGPFFMNKKERENTGMKVCGMTS